MKKMVVVDDRMQQGYVYWRTEPVAPELTPGQMLTLGVFGVKRQAVLQWAYDSRRIQGRV